MKDNNTLYWLWLAEKCGVASKYFGNLIEKYENPFDIYQLEEAELSQFDNISTALRDRLCEKNLDASYEKLKYCNQNRVDIISYGDKRYPERLKNLQDPPIVLYCKGFFPDFNASLCIGIVGTRKMSEYGRQSAYKISYDLARANVCTVSGMALGIDGVAACGALAAKGKTVAVLGCGIDTAYPKQHKTLMDAIAKNGAIITEYPPKEEPRSYNFPKRNRIISGLCQGVFVVEAAEASGALITADYALAQGRDLFALPGKISDANSGGPNGLIKNGAYTALSAKDIIKKYEFLYGDYLTPKRDDSRAEQPPEINGVLAKYGLDYAVSGEAPAEEKLFIAKGKKRVAVEGEATKPSTRDEANTEQSAGTRKRSGKWATPVRTPDESQAIVDKLDDATRLVYSLLSDEKPISCEELAEATALDMPKLLISLTMLELDGLIMSLPGGLYKKT